MTSPEGVGIRRIVFFLLGVAAHEFVRLADGIALDEAGEGLKDAEVDGALVAGDAYGGAEGTRHGCAFKP